MVEYTIRNALNSNCTNISSFARFVIYMVISGRIEEMEDDDLLYYSNHPQNNENSSHIIITNISANQVINVYKEINHENPYLVGQWKFESNDNSITITNKDIRDCKYNSIMDFFNPDHVFFDS